MGPWLSFWSIFLSFLFPFLCPPFPFFSIFFLDFLFPFLFVSFFCLLPESSIHKYNLYILFSTLFSTATYWFFWNSKDFLEVLMMISCYFYFDNIKAVNFHSSGETKVKILNIEYKVQMHVKIFTILEDKWSLKNNCIYDQEICQYADRSTRSVVRWENEPGLKAFEIPLTSGNWQKWKRVFLTCPCHKIYRDEAVGLKSCKNTW